MTHTMLILDGVPRRIASFLYGLRLCVFGKAVFGVYVATVDATTLKTHGNKWKRGHAYWAGNEA